MNRHALAEPPHALALLRVVVPLVILVSPELLSAPSLARQPASLAVWPEGLHWMAHVPLSAATGRALLLVTSTSAALVLLGYRARLAAAVLTVSGALTFALSQRHGAVLHDMHLFWMTALLAASPCADVWSIEAWGRPAPASSVRYGVPLTVARLLLGAVYFFPGLHKLVASGAGWATADNLIGHMHVKWMQNGRVPFFRPDHLPWLCGLAGVLVVAFELSFGALALFRRTRPLALLGGLAFHLSTQLLLFIPFVSLWGCYVVLLDGRRLARLAGHPVDEPAPDDAARWPRGVTVLGALMLVAESVQGLRGQTQAYPFACYPTFAHRQPSTMPDLVVELVDASGSVTRWTGRERGPRAQSDWAHIYWLATSPGSATHDAWQAHVAHTLRAAGAASAWALAREVRVYRVQVSTSPDDWALTPSGGDLVARWDGPAAGADH